MQSTKWEKIFASDVTDKGLVSKIYKQLMRFNIIKTNNPIKKMGRRTKYTFLQRRHIDGQQAHEKMFNITNFQRNANQNYNEVSPHTSQKDHNEKKKSPQTTNARGVEKREPSCTAGGNVN